MKNGYYPYRLDQLQKEIIQCNRCAKSWEEEKSKKSHAEKGPTSTAALPGLVIFQRPLPSNHEERKALLIGVNYVNSHAPLKGCVNDIWNLQCLLRHTLRYSPEQLQILADGFDGRPRPDRIPTKANIMAGLEWLVSTAQPGDHLLLVFSGYGCQHPRSPGSEKCESYLVPSDFVDELPKGFFKIVEMDNTALGGTLSADELRRQSEMATSALRGAKGSYRLVSMLEVHDFISRLPKRLALIHPPPSERWIVATWSIGSSRTSSVDRVSWNCLRCLCNTRRLSSHGAQTFLPARCIASLVAG